MTARTTSSPLAARAQQRLVASRALASLGQHAEALALALAGLEDALAATRETDVPDDALDAETERAAIDRRIGALPDDARAALHEALARGAEGLPRLDEGIAPQHERLRDLLDLAAIRVLEPSGARIATTERERRFARIALGGSLTLGAVFALYFALRTPPPRVVASGSYSRDYTPETIFDGSPATYWLLPDHANGWLEAHLSAPRDVHRITLLNTHNGHYQDRGTILYTLKLFAGNRLLQSVDGEFVDHGFGPNHHEFTAQGVDRIRFEVRSYYDWGGGLAEMQID